MATTFKARPVPGADYTLQEFALFLGEVIEDGDVRKVTSTSFEIAYDGFVSKFTGNNINITSTSASGTVKTWTVFEKGARYCSITMDNLSLSVVDKATNKEDNGFTSAVEKFLMSYSWNYVGTNLDDIMVKGAKVGDNVTFNTIKDDVYDLRGGNDKLFAGNGNDIVKGGSGNDKLWGGNGNDKLVGGTGKDNLLGDAGSDTLLGGGANDILNGGGGNDRLDGGKGNDKLLGKAGADTIVFKTGYGRDTVVGFGVGDKVDLKGHKAVDNFQQLMKTADDTVAGLEFDLGKDTLFFKGLDKGDVDAGDFMF